MSTGPSVSDESVWRVRDFRLVLAGGLVNNIGDWMFLVALPVYVYTESGSGSRTAAVFVIDLLISVVLGPVGGSLADRWNLRRTLIATNVLQAVALLPLLAVTPDRLWPVFVVAAMQSLLKQINDPASFALLPRVVDTSQLVQANAAYSVASSLARLVGSPAGGIAVAVGGLDAVVVIDAVSFVAVAAAMWFVRSQTGSLVPADNGEPAAAGVRAGLVEIRARPVLTAYIAIESLAQVAFAAFSILFIVFVEKELGGDGSEIGIIRGTAAFGGIVASILVARRARSVWPPLLMMWGYLSFGVVAALFINAPMVTTALWVYLVLFALSGLPNVTSQIGADSTAQLLCPPHVLGRLTGVMAAAGAVGAAIGSIGAGLLVDRVGIVRLFNVQAACYTTCGVLTYLTIVRRRASLGAPDGTMSG